MMFIKQHELNDSDRESALHNLKIFLAEGQIPWDALTFITVQVKRFVLHNGSCNYSWGDRKGALTPRNKNGTERIQ